MSFLYQNPSISHDESVDFLSSGVEKKMITALVSIGLNEQDSVWAQSTCLRHLAHDNVRVVASAITALGHIARRHGALDISAVTSALNNAKTRFPALEATVADTLDDIETFI